LPNYDELLEQARQRADAFRSTAKEFIPKMYKALRDEDPNTSPGDTRDRIEKDCIEIWSKRTIIEALPDEAKDPKKQKASRLRKKGYDSAAETAAESSAKNKKEIVIDMDGKAVENNIPSLTSTLSNLPLLSDDGDDNRLQNHSLIPFEFSLLVKDVLGYLMPIIPKKGHEEDQMWFSGVLDKSTREVISAAIGRRKTSLDGDTCDENTDYDYDR
jgi:hypothetical protein